MSGHEMFGPPMPFGIVLARKDYVDKLDSSVEYIGALDTTLSGSRNGHTTLLLWYAIQKNGMSGYKEIAKSCIETAEYAVTKLKENGVDAWRNRFSNTVVLPRPSLKTIDKWQLAPQRDLVHLITMPHVTKSEVDLFVSDYIND